MTKAVGTKQMKKESTVLPSAIVVKFGSFDYRGVYCHCDGYLDGLGRILVTHFDS